ncbi:MAG: hypothetical protein ACXWF8_00005 [Methylobacter sp.]
MSLDKNANRYNVTCFYLTIESSFENKLFQAAILCFVTEDQARAAGEVAKNYHKRCGIQKTTWLFTRKNEVNRQLILSGRINDTLDNIKAIVAAFFEAENAERQA